MSNVCPVWWMTEVKDGLQYERYFRKASFAALKPYEFSMSVEIGLGHAAGLGVRDGVWIRWRARSILNASCNCCTVSLASASSLWMISSAFFKDVGSSHTCGHLSAARLAEWTHTIHPQVCKFRMLVFRRRSGSVTVNTYTSSFISVDWCQMYPSIPT